MKITYIYTCMYVCKDTYNIHVHVYKHSSIHQNTRTFRNICLEIGVPKLKEILYRGFSPMLKKLEGVLRRVTYFRGGPKMCDKV